MKSCVTEIFILFSWQQSRKKIQSKNRNKKRKEDLEKANEDLSKTRETLAKTKENLTKEKETVTRTLEQTGSTKINTPCEDRVFLSSEWLGDYQRMGNLEERAGPHQTGGPWEAGSFKGEAGGPVTDKRTRTQDRGSTGLSSGVLAETLVTIFPIRPLEETTHRRSAGTTNEARFGESPTTLKLAVSGLSESAEEDANKVLDSVLPVRKPLRPALHETEATETLVSLKESPRFAISLGLLSTAAPSSGQLSYKR
jgi:hypothetical protein